MLCGQPQFPSILTLDQREQRVDEPRFRKLFDPQGGSRTEQRDALAPGHKPEASLHVSRCKDRVAFCSYRERRRSIVCHYQGRDNALTGPVTRPPDEVRRPSPLANVATRRDRPFDRSGRGGKRFTLRFTHQILPERGAEEAPPGGSLHLVST